MNDYNAIAGIYDKINSGVDYVKWADFIEARYKKYMKSKPEIVLDLACGTGKMTFEMAKRGYDMIGIDASEEMLMIASNNIFEASMNGELCKDVSKPLFLRQNMTNFELYGTVQAVLCCLDSLNYLTETSDLNRCFDLVRNYLEPGGLFFFDVNSLYKFEKIYSENAYVYDVLENGEYLESDGKTDEEKGQSSFCVWQNFYDKESKICDFFLTVFTEQVDGRYVRSDEDHRERYYSMDEIENALVENGFELLEVCADTSGKKVVSDSERWHFCARRK